MVVALHIDDTRVRLSTWNRRDIEDPGCALVFGQVGKEQPAALDGIDVFICKGDCAEVL